MNPRKAALKVVSALNTILACQHTYLYFASCTAHWYQTAKTEWNAVLGWAAGCGEFHITNHLPINKNNNRSKFKTMWPWISAIHNMPMTPCTTPKTKISKTQVCSSSCLTQCFALKSYLMKFYFLLIKTHHSYFCFHSNLFFPLFWCWGRTVRFARTDT